MRATRCSCWVQGAAKALLAPPLSLQAVVPAGQPDILLFVRQDVRGAAGVASAGEQHGRAAFQRQSNAGIRC